MSYVETAAATASIVGIEGRRLFIFIEDFSDSEKRFAYTLNGEPIQVTQTAVHKHGIVRGLNLVANGAFATSEIPWRCTDDGGIVGRNLSPQWTLAGAGTAYLSTAVGKQTSAEYLYGPGDPLIPVTGGEPYAFCGYFASHRCTTSIEIEFLTGDETHITSIQRAIPKMRGGQSIGDYANVKLDFTAPEQCVYIRIRFSINASAASSKTDDTDAYLFFTNVAFSMAGDTAATWRPCELHAHQIAALSKDAAIMDITLPRFSSSTHAPSPTFDVIDTITGASIRNSPVILPPAPALRLSVANFDGVTLTGEIAGATGRLAIDLIVDGAVADKRRFNVATDGRKTVSFRVPDSFLDGNIHIIELRDAVSGATFFVNAVPLKALVTSWEQVDDIGRIGLPVELHPLSRRRYRNLLAHIDSAARNPQQQRSSQSLLGHCHDILLHPEGAERAAVPLIFPEHADPEVSVVVCTSDAMRAYRTAAALLLAYNNTTFEVVISTDDTPEKIESLRGLIHGCFFVTSPSGTEHAQLANRGAAIARGKFVTLLDVNAEPGAFWLDELRAAFSLFDKVGVAGCKLVKPNGRLLDAGGVLWSSGNRQSVGLNGNAEHPQVNYTRQVDYVSDRALMVPTDIWRAVDGLSEELFRTGLADTDLSLKIREAGYKVVYAPQSVATLHADAKRSQPKQGSASQFKRRWSHSLQQRPPETSPLRTAMDFGIADRVLFIDQQVPRIDVDAGSYAAIQEMRLFQALGYKVTFLPLNLQYAETYVKSLERIGIEVIYAPFASSVEDVLRERGDEFRLVYVTRHHVARAVVPFVRRFNPQARIVFNNADLHFLRELRTALALNDGELLRRSRLTRDLELEIMRVTDLTISYNEVEHAVILSHNLDQTRIAKAPWVVAPAQNIAPLRERSGIGFLGSYGHRPNVDALKFFAQDVMPLLRQSRPDIRLNVFGSQIGPEVTMLENEYITIRGHVSDLADAFDPIKVFVAPLTAGAGLKGKVLNAMAHGVPTVLSPAAAEGIGALAGSHYLSAQSPEEWVSAIARLDSDETLWRAISQNALEFVKTNYSFETGVKTLRAALEKIDIFPAPTNEALCCRTELPPLR